jgi:hypothetical protein
MAEALAVAITQATGYAVTAAQVVTAAKVAFVAAQIGYSVHSAGKAKAAARAAYNASLSDRNVTLRGGDLPHEIVYGTVRKSTALWYATNQVVGPQEQYLWMVLGVAGHQCTAIGEIYLDADPLGPLDSNGDTTSGKFFTVRKDNRIEVLVLSAGLTVTTQSPVDSVLSVSFPSGDSDGPVDIGIPPAGYTVAGTNIVFNGLSGLSAGSVVYVAYTYVFQSIPLVRVKKYLGAPGQVADPDLMAASNGEWDANAVAPGETYVILRLRFDPVFQNWTQQVSCMVNGKLVFDPRSNFTGYSDNAALCTADYLRDALGFDLTAAELDTALLIAAANISDESVPTGAGSAVQKRYTVNVVLSTDSQLRDNLEMLLKAMAGSACPVQGKFRLFAGAFRTPDLVLTESDIDETGDDTVVPALGEADGFNAIKGKFSDETRLWQTQDYPSYASAVFIAEDQGRVRYADYDLEAVSHPSRATRLAKLRLFRSRNAMTFEARFKLTAYNTMPGKTVALKFPTFGWNMKVFQVVEREFSFEGWVRLVLQEDSASDYDWSYVEYPGAAQANNTNLPSPGDVPAVTGLTAQSGGSFMRVLSDGSQQAQIRLTWTSPNNSTVTQGGFVDIEHMRITDSAWTRMPALRGDETAAFIEPVSRLQRYLIRARFRNGLGVSSVDWTYLTHDVDTTAGNSTAVSVNGVGVNLLENASLRYGAVGWRCQFADGVNEPLFNGDFNSRGDETFSCQDGIGSKTGMNANARVRPYGAAQHSESAGNAYGFGTNRIIYSQQVGCGASQPMELQARLASSNADARLLALWYTAAGAFISETGIASVSQAEGFSGLISLENFKHAWGFATSPPNAAMVSLAVQPKRNVSSGSSFVWLSLPYLGRAHAGQARPSPWAGGQSVGTELVEPEMATVVLRYPLSVNSVSVSLLAGWKVEITINATVGGTTRALSIGEQTRGNQGHAFVVVDQPNGIGLAYGATAYNESSFPIGTQVQGTAVVSATFVVTQSGTHVFRPSANAGSVTGGYVRGDEMQLAIVKR